MSPDELAERIPLTHFPAHVLLDSAQGWPSWGELRPPAQLAGAVEAESVLDRIRHEHVFLYAGPACFALTPRATGDSVIYFRRELDAELHGNAAPFDTGACKPKRDGGRLQPYASGDEATCHTAIEASSVPTSSWRARMGAWLAHCYDDGDCRRYIETSTADEYVDGAPVRTQPPEILEHNGASGRTKKLKCADRRAWTWEVRTSQPVPLRRVRAVHVMPASFATALRRSHELAAVHGIDAPEVLEARAVNTSPRALYADSERVLEHLLAGAP